MPLDDHIGYISKTIYNVLGVDFEFRALNRNHKRKILEFWFSGVERDEGPVFTLSPKGLKNHKITVKFGNHSHPIIEQIQSADKEAFTFASVVFRQIVLKYESITLPEQNLENLIINSDFEFKVTVPCEELYDNLDSIDKTFSLVIIPIIGAFIELIGYEDNSVEFQGDEEGKIIHSFSTARERKKTNRAMCIALHGNKCGVCGFEPSTFYTDEINEIIEVHHIEPLSEIDVPRVYDPLEDLIPLCPNCHRAIHKRVPALSIDELRANIKSE